MAEALRLLTKAIARVRETDERWFGAELYCLHGEMLLHLPQPNQAGAEAPLLVVIEAMACGTPVIAFPSAPCPSWLSRV
jgi:glycosyltransferase involved in cell wall biosynthesis